MEPMVEPFSNKHLEDEKNKPVLIPFPVAAIEYTQTKQRKKRVYPGSEFNSTQLFIMEKLGQQELISSYL